MGRLFGTDGARGIAITELTCELAMQIGRAASIVLTKKMSHKPTILIGKDTRISSDILESALVAGICSVGANAKILGVVPTPAVAYLVRKETAFGLSTTNMLIHGDGNSNIVQGSCFYEIDELIKKGVHINTVLMNPPYNGTKKSCNPEYTKNWKKGKKAGVRAKQSDSVIQI